MAKCVNCAWFPWKPGADFSGLPAMRCHRELAARRWTKTGAEAETSCPLHEAAKSTEDMAEDNVTPTQVVLDAAVEVPVEKKPKAQTKTKPTKSRAKAKPKAKSKSKKE